MEDHRPTSGLLGSCAPQTHDILDTLSRHGVRATFFILGLVADAHPGLVRDIQSAGHQIGSHGWSHRLIYQQSRDEFRSETTRAKASLEDILGTSIAGYRAAEFSITAASLWALDVLAESGFSWDSSIFPIRGSRYGIADAPLGPYRVRTASGVEITEVPLTSVEWRSRRWPIGGGGYFRILPYRVTRAAIARVNAEGRAAVAYFHPYEFSAARLVPRSFSIGQYVSGARYVVFHNLNRRTNRRRLERMLSEYRFGPISEIIPHG